MNINASRSFNSIKNSPKFGNINEFAIRKLIDSYNEEKISKKEFKQGIKAIENDKSGDIAKVSHHAHWPTERPCPYSVVTPKVLGETRMYCADEFDTLAAAGAYANLYALAVKTEDQKDKAEYIDKMTKIYLHHAQKDICEPDMHDAQGINRRISRNVDETKAYFEIKE